MNQISPGFARRTTSPAPPATFSPRHVPMGIDPHRIHDAILDKRGEIAALELEWSSASERAAARAAGGVARLGDRETWDRATWDRYLSAASDCQDTYLPRLRRLYAEVSRLELLANPLPANIGRVA
ncbi:MAG: hypothetical protein KGH75_01565 [Rhodospirillales bacterium]|nr:hypothetical protein [Rhodospirillales bacterium]